MYYKILYDEFSCLVQRRGQRKGRPWGGGSFRCKKRVHDLLLCNLRRYTSGGKPWTRCGYTAVWAVRKDGKSRRGANENANGLLREFFPKKRSFTKLTQQQLYWNAVYRINSRPRQCLNWNSAQEMFRGITYLISQHFDVVSPQCCGPT